MDWMHERKLGIFFSSGRLQGQPPLTCETTHLALKISGALICF